MNEKHKAKLKMLKPTKDEMGLLLFRELEIWICRRSSKMAFELELGSEKLEIITLIGDGRHWRRSRVGIGQVDKHTHNFELSTGDPLGLKCVPSSFKK